jgi:hypothetical protein
MATAFGKMCQNMAPCTKEVYSKILAEMFPKQNSIFYVIHFMLVGFEHCTNEG